MARHKVRDWTSREAGIVFGKRPTAGTEQPRRTEVRLDETVLLELTKVRPWVRVNAADKE
jgi:hypothetical protein